MQGAAKLTQLQDFWSICGPKHEHPFCFTCTHLSGGALNGSLNSGQTGCAGSYPHASQKAWFQQGLGVLSVAARLPEDQKLGRCLCPSTLSQSPHQGLQHAQGGVKVSVEQATASGYFWSKERRPEVTQSFLLCVILRRPVLGMYNLGPPEKELRQDSQIRSDKGPQKFFLKKRLFLAILVLPCAGRVLGRSITAYVRYFC